MFLLLLLLLTRNKCFWVCGVSWLHMRAQCRRNNRCRRDRGWKWKNFRRDAWKFSCVTLKCNYHLKLTKLQRRRIKYSNCLPNIFSNDFSKKTNQKKKESQKNWTKWKQSLKLTCCFFRLGASLTAAPPTIQGVTLVSTVGWGRGSRTAAHLIRFKLYCTFFFFVYCWALLGLSIYGLIWHWIIHCATNSLRF